VAGNAFTQRFVSEKATNCKRAARRCAVTRCDNRYVPGHEASWLIKAMAAEASQIAGESKAAIIEKYQ